MVVVVLLLLGWRCCKEFEKSNASGLNIYKYIHRQRNGINGMASTTQPCYHAIVFHQHDVV